MYKIMRRHRLQIHTQVQAIDDRNTRTMMAGLRRSAFSTFVLFIVLMICYFPYLAAYIVRFICNAGDVRLWIQIFVTVVFLNSALNPLLYCWRHCWRIGHIRLAALQTFRRLVSREWVTKNCHSPLGNALLFFLFFLLTKATTKVKRLQAKFCFPYNSETSGQCYKGFTIVFLQE